MGRSVDGRDARDKAGTAGSGIVPSTGAPVMVALVSVPVLVLFWLLFGAYQRHEQQHADARDVVEIYRAGLQVLDPLDDMRSLSRARPRRPNAP